MERNSNCRALENKREVETGNIYIDILEKSSKECHFSFTKKCYLFICAQVPVFTHKLEDLLSS